MPSEVFDSMFAMCKDCKVSFPANRLYHLKTGEFLCSLCFDKDECLRKECNMPPNELMINDNCLNKQVLE